MSILQYARTRLQFDLEIYRKTRITSIHYQSGDQIKQTCADLGINPFFFTSACYMEAMLMVAIHSHDNRRYEKYTDALRHTYYLGPVGGMTGLRLPQKMFRHVLYDKEQLGLLKQYFEEGLPLWATLYDDFSKEVGSGKRIVEAIIYDPDFSFCPSAVQDEIMKAIFEGALDAAKRIGIIYDSTRPRRRMTA